METITLNPRSRSIIAARLQAIRRAEQDFHADLALAASILDLDLALYDFNIDTYTFVPKVVRLGPSEPVPELVPNGAHARE